MENNRIKELREYFGIMDSRNTYTEEELKELSTRKLYYIKSYKDIDSGIIYIGYKKVSGYVSEDKTACIFIKDGDITGNGDHYYTPTKGIRYCKTIKDGIYHETCDNIIFCTTDELDFCIEYITKYTQEIVLEEIKEIEMNLEKLKNISIIPHEIL